MVVASPKIPAMHPTLRLILWLTPTAVETVIVVAMVYRKLWRDLPIFLSYIIYEIGRTVFLFTERNNPWIYFCGYWVTEAVGCFAALWVIRELFDNAFHRHLGLLNLGRVLFRWSAVILLASAVLVAWISPGSEPTRLMAGIYVLKRTVTVVQTGLLVFLFIFSFSFGLSWQHYAVGISSGLGVYGSVELAALAIRMRYGHPVQWLYNWMMMTINNCCVFIWAAYFLYPAAKRNAAQMDVFLAQDRLEEWNRALLLLLKK
jgi:hypothetical protein